MKKIIIILAVALSNSLMAQKGNWYAGGVVGFASNTHANATGFETKTSEWAFGPEAGTFLKDDIQLGLALGLSGTSVKNDNGKVTSSSNLSPTVYVRKFFKVTDNFRTFAGFYLNYTSGKSTDYLTPTESTQSGVGMRVGIGVAYSLSPRFTAIGQYGLMGFQSVTNKAAGTTTGKDTSFDFGVNTIGSSTLGQGNGSGSVFNIGLYYTFKKL